MKGLTRAVIASFAMCALYAAAAIKIAKHITKDTETERRIRRIKREGLPVEKADLQEKTGNTYEDYYDEGDDHIYG